MTTVTIAQSCAPYATVHDTSHLTPETLTTYRFTGEMADVTFVKTGPLAANRLWRIPKLHLPSPVSPTHATRDPFHNITCQAVMMSPL